MSKSKQNKTVCESKNKCKPHKTNRQKLVLKEVTLMPFNVMYYRLIDSTMHLKKRKE